MSDAMGRRPDGPGWYWYTGPGQWRGSIDEPVWVSPPYVECRTRHRDEIVGDMPGDFVPLTKPVAAQEPDWSQAPEWAMWTTVDATGMRQWWGNEPPGHSTSQCMWMNGEYPGKYATGGRIDLPIGCDWRTTLRRRPEVGDE